MKFVAINTTKNVRAGNIYHAAGILYRVDAGVFHVVVFDDNHQWEGIDIANFKPYEQDQVITAPMRGIHVPPATLTAIDCKEREDRAKKFFSQVNNGAPIKHQCL